MYLWVLSELWGATRVRAGSLGDGTYIEGATVAARVILVMFMVDQLKIDYLRNGIYGYFIWFLFGLIMAVGNVARAEAGAAAVPEPATRKGASPIRARALASPAPGLPLGHPPRVAAGPAA